MFSGSRQVPIFVAGIVLLLKFWAGRQSGLLTDANNELNELTDIHKCMNVLRSMEDR